VSGGVNSFTFGAMTITQVSAGITLAAAGAAVVSAFMAGWWIGDTLYRAGTYVYYDLDWY
jgi:hypothetical protein